MLAQFLGVLGGEVDFDVGEANSFQRIEQPGHVARTVVALDESGNSIHVGAHALVVDSDEVGDMFCVAGEFVEGADPASGWL